MKIYMVREDVEYEVWNIVGAHLSEEAAEAQAAQEAVASSYAEYTVEEWEVN